MCSSSGGNATVLEKVVYLGAKKKTLENMCTYNYSTDMFLCCLCYYNRYKWIWIRENFLYCAASSTVLKQICTPWCHKGHPSPPDPPPSAPPHGLPAFVSLHPVYVFPPVPFSPCPCQHIITKGGSLRSSHASVLASFLWATPRMKNAHRL